MALKITGIPTGTYVPTAGGLTQAAYVDFTGVTDAGPVINAAIAKLPAQGGDILILPLGSVPAQPTLLVNTTIGIGNGSASGDSTVGGIRLILPGFPGVRITGLAREFGWVKIVAGPSLAGKPVVQVNGPMAGWGLIGGWWLDNTTNNNAGSWGLKVVSAQMGEVPNIRVIGFAYCIHETTVAQVGSEVNDTFHNHYGRVEVRHDGSSGAFGMSFNSTVAAVNTCYTTVDDLILDNPTGVTNTCYGVSFGACDNVIIRRIQNNGNGSGYEVLFYNFANGHSTSFPADCTVEAIDFGGGAAIGSAGTFAGNGPNRVLNISATNGINPTTDPNTRGVELYPNSPLQEEANYPAITTPAVPAASTPQVVTWSLAHTLYVTAGAGGSATLSVNGAQVMVLPASQVAPLILRPGDCWEWTGTAPASTKALPR